jgi:hypothetical protein
VSEMFSTNSPEISSATSVTTSGRRISTAAMPSPMTAGARPDHEERRLRDLLAGAFRSVGRAELDLRT